MINVVGVKQKLPELKLPANSWHLCSVVNDTARMSSMMKMKGESAEHNAKYFPSIIIFEDATQAENYIRQTQMICLR